MKMLTRLLLSCLLLTAIGMIGCSDDSQSIVSPATESLYGTGDLVTNSDWTGTEFDLNDYISQGYYYPEDNQEDVNNTWDPNNHDDPSDVNTKPLDNGLIVE